MASPKPHGKKWRIRWVDEWGLRRSETYQSQSDAELALRGHLLLVDRVSHGLAAPEVLRQHHTFDELADHWMATRATMKRAASTDEAIIRVHLRPTFGHLRLADLGTDAVARFAAELGARVKPKTVHNILTLLRAMLGHALDLGWLDKVPRIRKPVVRLDEHDFRYLRSDDEIARFLDAAATLSAFHLYFYATAIYTGLRAGELAALQWGDVDLNARLITVQRSRDGATKSGRVRHVPILDVLLPMLQAWRMRTGGTGLVFANRDGKMLDRSGPHFKVARVLKLAGLPVGYICFHSLRHTFASSWVRAGGDVFKLQRVMGHSSIVLTQRYAHLQPDAYTADLALFGAAPSTERAQVLPLRPARTPFASNA